MKLKLIRSIHTILSQSKTCKVVGLFFLLVFVLGSVFLSTGLQAFASNTIDSSDVTNITAQTKQPVYSGFIVTALNGSSGNSTPGSVNSGYWDYYVPVAFNIYLGSDIYKEFSGSLEVGATVSLSGSNQVNSYHSFGLVDYEVLDNDLNFDIWTESFSYNSGYTSGSGSIYFYFNMLGQESLGRTLFVNCILHFRETISDSTGWSPESFDQHSINISGYSYRKLNVVSYSSERYLLGKICDSVGALSDIYNLLSNDQSGVSDNVNSAASSAAAAESAADNAISTALPSADAQLNSIASYDYNSIATNNTTALSFWKSLGDWLLSNSNLVGIGALLIGCLFIGFVVYLLRL